MQKSNGISQNNEILNNILRLMKLKGVRQADLARHLGISSNAISQWKINRSSSYMNYLDKLAAFFDVSTEELLHPDKTKLYDSFISQDEMELLDMYRSLTDDKLKSCKKITRCICQMRYIIKEEEPEPSCQAAIHRILTLFCQAIVL